jgi:hypothetical protein
MRHRLGKGVVGLVAGLAAIGLLSLPAAANTATIQFINSSTGTPGNVTIFNADEEAVASFPLPGTTGLSCSSGTNGISAALAGTATGGTITVTFTNHCNAFVVSSIQYCSFMSGTLTGTYALTGTVKTYTSTNTSGITLLIRKNTGTTHNCHTTTTTFCTVIVTGLSVSGIITSANPLPTLAVSDTATIGGGSSVGGLLVSGTATTCGVFIGFNNGFITMTAHVHAASVT